MRFDERLILICRRVSWMRCRFSASAFPPTYTYLELAVSVCTSWCKISDLGLGGYFLPSVPRFHLTVALTPRPPINGSVGPVSLHVYVRKSPSSSQTALRSSTCTHSHKGKRKEMAFLRSPLVDIIGRITLVFSCLHWKQSSMHVNTEHSSLRNKPSQTPRGFIVSRSDTYLGAFEMILNIFWMLSAGFMLHPETKPQKYLFSIHLWKFNTNGTQIWNIDRKIIKSRG